MYFKQCNLSRGTKYLPTVLQALGSFGALDISSIILNTLEKCSSNKIQKAGNCMHCITMHTLMYKIYNLCSIFVHTVCSKHFSLLRNI